MDSTTYSTKLQDCNVIAQAFERGAAYNTDEASVIALTTRHVQNTKTFSQNAQSTLSKYQHQPSATLQNQDNADPSNLSGMKIGNQYIAVPTKNSASILSKAVKDCVPCLDRVIHNIDLNVGSDLLNALKADVNNRLNILNSLKDLLSNVDIYGDFCQMASFLNFMCVPDLQRMLVVLSAMLTDFSTGLITASGMLQALLAPFFTPVLMGITGLLDQLVQLVLSPLTCIITSIEENITKLDVGALVGDPTLTSAKRNIDSSTRQTVVDIRQIQGTVRSSLMELYTSLNEGNTLIRTKLQFYTQQLNKLLGQWGAHDTTALALANKKVINIRLIGLIKAMIQAKSVGASMCEGQTPTSSELDNFFNTFVSPNSPFNLSVDGDGNLNISLKPSTSTGTNLSGTPLLTQPATPRIIKCKLSSTTDEISQVNDWIASLNQ